MAHDADAPRYLEGHLEEALASDGRVVELGLKVSVGDGVVVVTGAVSTPERQAGVTEVINELAPGYDVDNRTTVSPLDEPESSEALP